MNRTLAKRALEVRLTDEAKRWIVNKTCADRSYGARPLRRALQKFVEDPLSEALIQGEIGEASIIEVFVDENGLNHRPAGVEEPGDALLIH
jgi:ATP-dependent Clp protease ATP-binding subunit ClpC